MDGDGDDGDGEFFNESNTTTLEDTRAKDLFTTITTRDGFVAASWEESQTHLLLFLGLWAGLLLVSLTMGISRRIWSPDSLNKQLGMQIAVLKHSAYWNIFMFLLLSSLVVLYVLRAERIRLDENLTFLEITAVSFYAIEAAFTVVEVPPNWRGLTFGQLFSFMMRKRNMMPMALLRKTNAQDALDFIDSSVESRRVEDPEEKLEVLYGKVSQMVEDWRSLLDAADQKRWQPGGQPFGRYTLVMPAGTSFVVYNDGVLCMQPTTRTTLPQTGVKRERFDDPLSRQQLAAMSVKS